MGEWIDSLVILLPVVIIGNIPSEFSDPTKEITRQNVESNPWLLLARMKRERREVG